MTIEIVSHTGEIAVVDDEDSYLLNFKWYTLKSKKGIPTYLVRHLYPRINGKIKNNLVLIHRDIMSRRLGRLLLKSEEVDHVDQDTFNCRRSNLRVVTKPQNGINRPKRSDSKLKFKGIDKLKYGNKYRGRIAFNGIQFKSRALSSELAAAVWYDMQAMQLHGEFASLNFEWKDA